MPIQISEAASYLKDLYSPEAVGPIIGDKLVPNIVLSPLVTVNDRLVGRPGDTVTLPFFKSIGEAEHVPEGDRIPLVTLYEDFVKVKVRKIGKAALVTDEALLCGRGKPTLEILRQFSAGIASKVDDELLDALDGMDESMVYEAANSDLDPAELPAAAAKFGEETDGPVALLVDPDTRAALMNTRGYLPASDVAAGRLIKGAVGTIYGMSVFVSNRIKGRHALYLVKPGALSLYLKRDVLVEADRDIMNQSTVLTISKLFAPYLARPKRAVKIKLKLSYLVDQQRDRIQFGDTYIIIN